jgi:hypothetical protein
MRQVDHCDAVEALLSVLGGRIAQLLAVVDFGEADHIRVELGDQLAQGFVADAGVAQMGPMRRMSWFGTRRLAIEPLASRR